MNSSICTLDKLKIGQEAIVIEVNIQNLKLKRRLFELGLTEGEIVKIKKFGLGGNPVCIELIGYELCISKEILEKVVVLKGNGPILRKGQSLKADGSFSKMSKKNRHQMAKNAKKNRHQITNYFGWKSKLRENNTF